METFTQCHHHVPEVARTSLKPTDFARARTSCRRSAKPYQGSQWAIFRFPRHYPTISSSIFEQPLLQTAPASRQSSVPAAVPSPAASATAPTNVAKGMLSNGKPNGGRVQIKRKTEPQGEWPAAQHQPSRTSSQASTSNAAQGSAPQKSRSERQVPPHLAPRQQDRQRTGATPSGRATPVGDSEPPSKRQKGLSGEPSVPSLLSRLALIPPANEQSKASAKAEAPSPPLPAKRRVESEQQSQSRSAVSQQQQQRARPAQTNANALPPGGWSIKGAARASQQPEPPTPEPQSASLLDRLKRSDTGGGGQSRRKRVKT